MNNQFRLDIQGLRAISVLLVFLSHAGYSFFSGGFVGVDVFFVISGYVITGLIVKEFALTGQFCFSDFYIKRTQRLVPALFFMIFVVLIFVFLYFQWTFDQSAKLIESAYYAIFWTSNFYFNFSEIDYFASELNSQLFLHTWSLGVEEQFYLFWPVLIFFILKSFKSNYSVVAAVSGVIVLSLTLHFCFSISGDSFSFYMMPTRVWQFGIGGLIAFLHFKNILIYHDKLNNGLGVLGLIFIFGSAILLTDQSRYPYWQAAIPTIGAACILMMNDKKPGLGITLLLSSKPFVWLGNLSYSVYLWHWPMIYILFWHFNIPQDNLGHLLLVVVTTVVSAFSFYFIERPIRYSAVINRESNKNKALLFVSGFIILTASIDIYNGVYRSNFVRFDDGYKSVAHDRSELYEMPCDSFYHDDSLTPCVFGNKSSKKTVVVVGDSVMVQWFSIIQKKYDDLGWKLIVLTKSSCPVVEVPFYYKKIMSTFDVCDAWKENVYRYVEKIRPDVLILGNSNNYPFSDSEWSKGLSRLFSKLIDLSPNIKYVLATPENNQCIGNQENTLKCEFPYVVHQKEKWQKKAAESFKQVQIVDLNKYVCPEKMCSNKYGNISVFGDKVHLTNSFVVSLYDVVAKYF